jgi:hypothetical protein
MAITARNLAKLQALDCGFQTLQYQIMDRRRVGLARIPEKIYLAVKGAVA